LIHFTTCIALYS